jgi:heat shock protein HtpX
LSIRVIAAVVPIAVVGGLVVALLGALVINVGHDIADAATTVDVIAAVLVTGYFATVTLMLIVGSVAEVGPRIRNRREILLKGLHVREVEPDEAPELHGALDRLCALADIPKPTLMVGDAAFPIMITLGTTLCVTCRLLERLDPEELDAVLAHEVAHLLNEDDRVMRTIGFVGEACMTLPRELRKDLRVLSVLPYLLLGWAAYLLCLPMVMVASRTREYLADDYAVRLTGNSSQLASALIKLSAEHDVIPIRDLRKVAPSMALMCVDVNGTRSRSRYLLRAHPPLRRRLKRLGITVDTSWQSTRTSPTPPQSRRNSPLDRALALAGMTHETLLRPRDDPCWDQLWRLVLDAPLVDAIAMAKLFRDWRPEDSASRALFDRLVAVDPQHAAAVREEFAEAVLISVPITRRPDGIVSDVALSFTPSGSSLTATATIEERCDEWLRTTRPVAIQHMVIEIPGGHVVEESRSAAPPDPIVPSWDDAKSPDGRFRAEIKHVGDGIFVQIIDIERRPILGILDAPMTVARPTCVPALRWTSKRVDPPLAHLLRLLADCLTNRFSNE